MSNKPKIYGFCPAGCRHETVHYEDFVNSASLIVQPRNGYVYKIAVGNTYKIKNTKAPTVGSWGFTITVSTSWEIGEGTYATGFLTVTLPTFDKYADGVSFALLDIKGAYDGEACFFSAVYEINGERHTETFADGDFLTHTAPTADVEYSAVATCTTDEAEDLLCYRYNADAQIIFESDTSDANATSEQILKGATAYVGGVKVEGEISTYDSETVTEVIAAVVQETGDSTVDVMSQDATTKAIKEQAEKLQSGIITRNSKRLDNLEAGIPAEDFVTDATAAAVKDVPADALPYAEVVEIGGLTQRVNVGTEEAPEYVLRSAPVKEVESVGANIWDEQVYPFTEGVWISQSTGVTGKGEAYKAELDYIPISRYVGKRLSVSHVADGSNPGIAFYDDAYVFISGAKGETAFTVPENAHYMRFTVNIDDTDVIINVGTTALDYTPYVRNTLPIPAEVQAKEWYGLGISADVYNSIRWNEDGSRSGNVKCDVLDLTDVNWVISNTYAYSVNVINSAKPNGAILFGGVLTGSPSIRVATSKQVLIDWGDTVPYTQESLKAAMSGVMLVYELATPTTEDISDILPADNLIGVEGGGTVTMISEYGYDVPSEIVYQIDNSESEVS